MASKLISLKFTSERRVLMEVCSLPTMMIRGSLWEEVIFDWGPIRLSRTSFTKFYREGKAGHSIIGSRGWGTLIVPGGEEYHESGKGRWFQIMWGCGARLRKLNFI